MPKQIYNEGRVVGYSQYELYLKHALSEHPEIDPLSEKEWLASQIGNGVSLLLKVPAESSDLGLHFVDFPLPENSRLRTANTIVASQFFGECEVDDNNWATKVIDYGRGISNTQESSPTTTSIINGYPYTDVMNYPKQNAEFFTATEQKALMQYVKIQDGLILQPGAWSISEVNPPEKDFNPDLYNLPILRLIFASQITEPFYVLLTQFSDVSTLAGISNGDEGSLNLISPEDGDFLGPERYPWANKVIFTYPTATSYYLRKNISSVYDNLKIDHSDDDINTIFKVSYLKPSFGTSIYGPNEPGGDIYIGSKISNDSNKFIKIEQTTSIEDNTSNDRDQVPNVTEITHSKVIPGNGIALNGPNTPGGDVAISSVIQVDSNKMLKCEQSASTTADAATTILKASTITSTSNSGVNIAGPDSYGADIIVSAPIESNNSAYLRVDQIDYKTILKPAEFASNTSQYLTMTFDQESGKIYFDLNLDSLKDLLLEPALHGLEQILAKIGDNAAGTSLNHDTGDITWGGSLSTDTDPNQLNRIPVGNLNIYSSSSSSANNDKYIVTHSPDAPGDLAVR